MPGEIQSPNTHGWVTGPPSCRAHTPARTRARTCARTCAHTCARTWVHILVCTYLPTYLCHSTQATSTYSGKDWRIMQGRQFSIALRELIYTVCTSACWGILNQIFMDYYIAFKSSIEHWNSWSSSFGKTSLYIAEPLLLGWFWAFFSFAGQFLLRIPPGNSRVWSHYAQWSFTLLTDFPRCALWNIIEVEVYHGHGITTTCLSRPRKNSVETSCCQEFLQILWWNCNKFCQDWLKIISFFIHTHTHTLKSCPQAHTHHES